MKRIIFVLIFLFLNTTLIYAESDNSWHDSYRGRIGDTKGGLVLVFNKNDISGELYFDSDYVDIPLFGKINEREVELSGADGTVLKGKFAENDPQYGNAPLKKEVLNGIITRNGVNQDFYVSMNHGSAGDLKHKYYIAGFDNDTELESFVGDFKEAVLTGNKEQVVKMLWYPITVSLRNGSKEELKTSDEFLELYDDVFYPEFLKVLKGAVTHDMFAKYDGVMMSSDDNNFWVWFSCLGSPEEKKIGVLSIFSDIDKLLKVMEKVTQ